MVNVYIKDPAVTQIIRDQKVPLIWFVANIGGILGLTMGMSLVTFFEIMHHVAMLFFRTGAKSLASVRRTMTINSIQMRTRNASQPQQQQPQAANGEQQIVVSNGGQDEEICSTKSGKRKSPPKAVLEEFEETTPEIQNGYRTSRVAKSNGYSSRGGKRQCMTVFVPSSSDSVMTDS